uniref:unspecific monooxygenase n=1 Tax=Bombyx mandarina TaxID=7092 RepID=A9QW15_BOMMA|nr:cytochrome P450 CYP6AE9 [Bombyx mandarina]
MFLLINICVILFVIYYLLTKKYSYWRNRNVSHEKPVLLLGNYGDLILQKKNFGEMAQAICQKFPGEPVVGAFFGTEPVLIPQDPEVIKTILTKDFYYFNGREISEHVHKELLSYNLFATYGDEWKILRQNLTPIFSTAKLKSMFTLIEKCSKSFQNLLEDETKISKELEVRTLMQRFTIECIGSCIFGVDTDTLGNDKMNPFKTVGSQLSDFSRFVFVKGIVRAIWPTLFYALGFKTLTTELDIFKKLVNAVFTQRKHKPTTRNDFIDIILTWKNNNAITGDSIGSFKNSDKTKFSIDVNDDLLLAQCLVFFAAGFETSAMTSSYTLHELAKNQRALKKACDEVDAYLLRHGNKINYDCVTELPYLEACIEETLRLYPVLGIITREVMEDYVLLDKIHLKKGDRIHVPVFHLHHNPEHFPNPEEYRPERFYGEEKRKVKPYTYLPFGEGPRICIGMRFAKMQSIAGLITILKKFRLELPEGAPTKIEFKPEAFVTTPKDLIKIKFLEREGWQQRVFV